MFIAINGVEQRVSVSGDDPAHPALMLVNGAGVALSRMSAFFAPWESAFRLVYWDQPTTEPVTFDRLAADGVAVAEQVRGRIGVDRLILLGASGGSIVGLKMVKARPDLFSAYVGTGQIVRGVDVTESTEGLVLTPAELASLAAMPPQTGGDQRAEATRMYERLRESMASFDARALGLEYRVPMFFLQGELDRYTPIHAVTAFERDISAPRKALVRVAGGGHAAVFLRDRFLTLLVEHVKPAIASW